MRGHRGRRREQRPGLAAGGRGTPSGGHRRRRCLRPRPGRVSDLTAAGPHRSGAGRPHRHSRSGRSLTHWAHWALTHGAVTHLALTHGAVTQRALTQRPRFGRSLVDRARTDRADRCRAGPGRPRRGPSGAPLRLRRMPLRPRRWCGRRADWSLAQRPGRRAGRLPNLAGRTCPGTGSRRAGRLQSLGARVRRGHRTGRWRPGRAALLVPERHRLRSLAGLLLRSRWRRRLVACLGLLPGPCLRVRPRRCLSRHDLRDGTGVRRERVCSRRWPRVNLRRAPGARGDQAAGGRAGLGDPPERLSVALGDQSQRHAALGHGDQPGRRLLLAHPGVPGRLRQPDVVVVDQLGQQPQVGRVRYRATCRSVGWRGCRHIADATRPSRQRRGCRGWLVHRRSRDRAALSGCDRCD